MRRGQPPTWKQRYPDEVTCVRCLQVRDKDDVDRLLWCEACRARARARAGRWGWLVGAAAAILLSLWILLWVRPDPELVLGGWLASVVATFWLGAKVAREVAYGAQRFANRNAAEAVPPLGDGEPDGDAAHDPEDPRHEEKR